MSTKRFLFPWRSTQPTTHLTPASVQSRKNPLSALVPAFDAEPLGDWKKAMTPDDMRTPGLFKDMPIAEVNRRHRAHLPPPPEPPKDYEKPKVVKIAGIWYVTGIIDGYPFTGNGPTARIAWKEAQCEYFHFLSRLRNLFASIGA